MKKIIAVTLALVLMLSLAGCAKGGATNDEASKDETVYAESFSENAEPEEQAETEDSPEPEDDSSEADSGLLSPEFKQTMDDYEAWFDHYCDVMKRYQEDSSDLELLTEMTDLLTEETEMLEEMENMDQSEMNTAELAYYLEVTARIEKKLLEASGY